MAITNQNQSENLQNQSNRLESSRDYFSEKIRSNLIRDYPVKNDEKELKRDFEKFQEYPCSFQRRQKGKPATLQRCNSKAQ